MITYCVADAISILEPRTFFPQVSIPCRYCLFTQETACTQNADTTHAWGMQPPVSYCKPGSYTEAYHSWHFVQESSCVPPTVHALPTWQTFNHSQLYIRLSK